MFLDSQFDSFRAECCEGQPASRYSTSEYRMERATIMGAHGNI